MQFPYPDGGVGRNGCIFDGKNFHGMKKVWLGIVAGAIAGVIDVIPMVIQKMTWDANLSAFFHWVTVGFFIATTNVGLKGALKGLLIAIVTLLPIAFLVWWHDPSSIVPMSISTVIFGLALGFVIDKYGR